MSRNERWEVGDRPSLDIRVPVGTIEVYTGDAGAIQLTIDANDVDEFEIFKTGDRVSVRHPSKWGRRSRNTRLVAHVPAGTVDRRPVRLQLKTVSGDIRVERTTHSPGTLQPPLEIATRRGRQSPNASGHGEADGEAPLVTATTDCPQISLVDCCGMGRRLVASAILLILAGMAGGAPVDAAPVAGAAIATRSAARDVAFTPGAQCDLVTAQSLSNRHPGVRQFVIVASDAWTSTTATLQIVAQSTSGQWRCQQAPVVARLGKTGSRPLADRRSGDGTTPAGSFPLGSVRAWDGEQFHFFGNRPDPGVRGAYRLVRNEDCWGATPNTSSYQAVVNDPGCTSPNEWLTRIGDVYGHAAVIGANLDPISGNAPGELALAAGIFLHRNSFAASGASTPTSGCVSLGEEDLEVAVRLIDPELGVQFAIGELLWLRNFA